MSNDVTAAEDPYDQGNVDNRISQASLSAAISLVRKWGEAHRFLKSLPATIATKILTPLSMQRAANAHGLAVCPYEGRRNKDSVDPAHILHGMATRRRRRRI